MLRRSPWSVPNQRIIQRQAPQPDRDQPAAQKPQNIWGQNVDRNAQVSWGGSIQDKPPAWADGFTRDPQVSWGGGVNGGGVEPSGGFGGAAGPGGGGTTGGPAPRPNPQPEGPPSVIGNQGPRGNSLEMNPHYQQGMAALDEELRGLLTGLGVAEADLEAQLKLIKARLGMQHKETLRRTDEGANERGIFNSGIRHRDRGYVDNDFNEKYQDNEINRARGLRDIASARNQAYANRNKGLSQLALDIAALLGEDPGMDVDSGGDEGFDAEPSAGGNGGGKARGGKKRAGKAQSTPKKRWGGNAPRFAGAPVLYRR